MQLFTTRPTDKVHLPDIEATIEVVAIQGGTVRLGIAAPEEVRVVREPVSGRRGQWAPEVGEDPSSYSDIQRLLEKRLEISQEGLNEARHLLRMGDRDGATLLIDKVDEDLHLLRRRIRKEFEKAEAVCVGL
jgi:sRNA-binding carbon storage regulator CsrA